jgi:hypothetical protein
MEIKMKSIRKAMGKLITKLEGLIVNHEED